MTLQFPGSKAPLLAALIAVCGFAPAAGRASPAPAEEYRSYGGTANVRHSQDFLYGERHVLHYRDGALAERVVLYTCRDGSAFARKRVSYTEPQAPDFELVDAANGLREGIRTQAGQRRVFFQASPAVREKSGPLPAVAGLVADAGFDEFVRSHWDRLASGAELSIRFLVPSRLQDYGFEVERVGSAVRDGIATQVFRLKLAGFWGWFLRGIDVYYSDADHVLVYYDGLSDLRDAAGDNYKAEIDFPPAARQLSSEQAMSDALKTPLRPCR